MKNTLLTYGVSTDSPDAQVSEIDLSHSIEGHHITVGSIAGRIRSKIAEWMSNEIVATRIILWNTTGQFRQYIPKINSLRGDPISEWDDRLKITTFIIKGQNPTAISTDVARVIREVVEAYESGKKDIPSEITVFNNTPGGENQMHDLRKMLQARSSNFNFVIGNDWSFA